ncbi:hypothetical protein [Enterovirga rhinocerotis]|uniref:hypothetical protein n=1 Tax=Enterovirga rhinocerotis TaxID=1339210 RepID=UPI001414F925|nr:hypothetical protein [Enterovirga rhinocerotis]
MKYHKFEEIADLSCQKQPTLSSTENVVALRRSSGDAPGDRGRGAGPIFVSCASATASSSGAPVSAPSRRVSWFDKLASDFGIAGQALAFGSIAELGLPQPLPSSGMSAHPRRHTWLSRFKAAVARRYHRVLSEIAIGRAVQDLRRLDTATLRDIGICDRAMIETFVRGVRDR